MTLPTPSEDNLRLAYEQQIENVREAKRLQWNLTYLGVLVLTALVGADELLRDRIPSDARVAAYVFVVLGVLTTWGAVALIGRASGAMQQHRRALRTIAEKLEDPSSPYDLKQLLGIPHDYGTRCVFEPILMQLALCAGAATLGWLLCGSIAALIVAVLTLVAVAVSSCP